MSNFLNEPYSTFSKRLTDWLNTAGGEVSNLTLDLSNRAQARLWMYRAWDGLVRHRTLYLTNKTAKIHADFGGTICRVYVDTNGDGKPDMYYYRDGPVENGYRLINSFSKAVGQSWNILFFSTPATNPVIVYPKVLDDFVGTGTEYSYFPPDLLVAQAKVIHIESSDLVGDEYKTAQNEFATLIRDYEQANQYQNIEQRMAQLDANGDELSNEGYDLAGGSETDFAADFDNDYDLGG